MNRQRAGKKLTVQQVYKRIWEGSLPEPVINKKMERTGRTSLATLLVVYKTPELTPVQMRIKVKLPNIQVRIGVLGYLYKVGCPVKTDFLKPIFT